MWAAHTKEHPFDFDFQLLELAEPLRLNENIQPVKIAHIEDMVVGKVITVTGWGNTDENVSKFLIKIFYNLKCSDVNSIRRWYVP